MEDFIAPTKTVTVIDWKAVIVALLAGRTVRIPLREHNFEQIRRLAHKALYGRVKVTTRAFHRSKGENYADDGTFDCLIITPCHTSQPSQSEK